MAFGVYTKSLIWLVSFGGAGYVLMLLTEPNKSKLSQIKQTYSSPLSAEDKKKMLFMQKLKDATSETPIYLQKTKKE